MPKRKNPSVYFTSLEIENVRCFGDRQELDLTADGRRPARWTLILGDNGVGKTTLLQCLAWMRLVPAGDNSALLAEENEDLERLLQVGPHTEFALSAKLSIGSALSSAGEIAKGAAGRGRPVDTSIRLFFDAKRQLSQERESKFETTLSGEFEEPLVVAYGANRQRGVRNLNKRDLFDPLASRLSDTTELYDFEQILSDLDYASQKRKSPNRDKTLLNKLKMSLAKILPENVDPDAIQIYPPDVLDRGDPTGVYLKTFTGLIPISQVSLGYQTMLAWTADLAWRLIRQNPGTANPLAEPAVVLIDEIDLHLHPLWQLRVMDDLSAIFPGTQFVATSHSPLMVQVAESANFVLLRKRETDVEIVNDPRVIRSWRVDQILTSEMFGLPGARNKQTEHLFARRDQLAMMPLRSAEEEVELERLRVQISEIPSAGDQDDQSAMDLIRRAAELLRLHNIVES